MQWIRSIETVKWVVPAIAGLVVGGCQNIPLSSHLSIVDYGIVLGGCPATSVPAYTEHVYQNEVFAVVTKVSVPSPGTNKQVKIALGIDSRGAHGQTVQIESFQSGEVLVCAGGFTLDWPMRAQLRVELFEEGTWKSRRSRELAVVPRGRAEAVFMPLFSHTSVRVGFPRRIILAAGHQLVLQTGVYVANGTANPVTMGTTITGEMAGTSVSDPHWQVNLRQPITVEPFSVSAIDTFSLSYNSYSSIGQKLLNDKIVMLAKLQGDYTTPGRVYDDTDVLDWKTLPGIGVDLVFVGDYPADVRADVQRLVNNEVNGYLQRAQIKLHSSSARVFTAERVGMSNANIAELRNIENNAECAQLAAFQPLKSFPRFTIYFTEGLFAAGFVGCYADGGQTPVDPNTPFRSPILRLRANELQPRDPPTGFEGGRQFLASVIAHEIGHAFGLGGHTDSDSCGDTDHTRAEDTFNLMFFGVASYSRILTACQMNTLKNHGEFFRY